MKFSKFIFYSLCFALFTLVANADPLLPAQYYSDAYYMMPQAQRAGNSNWSGGAEIQNPRAAQGNSASRAGGATSQVANSGTGSRASGGRSGNQRTGSAEGTSPRGGARSVTARTATPIATGAAITQAAGAAVTQSRAAASGRATNARSATPARGGSANQRTVTARSATPIATGANVQGVAQRAGAQNRTVRARNAATTEARLGVQGRVLGGKPGGNNANNQLTQLYNRMNVGSVSNILDPMTGLISADAYSNCIEGYYACMDEICTARSPGQRRCACAARVQTYNAAEQLLQKAREDLLKASGELSLLIAAKGKDISAAFQLTDAEKVLNCVAFRDAKMSGELQKWCLSHITTVVNDNHNFDIDNGCYSSSIAEPSFCRDNKFGWGNDWMNTLNGADSDILSLLETAAKNTENLNMFVNPDDNNLFASVNITMQIVNNMNGLQPANPAEAITDQLAKTWGYDLFTFAHNNVCGRVLDSCFNGIYEACGSVGSGNKSVACRTAYATTGDKGPYNYNSCISINNQSDLTGAENNATGTADTFFIARRTSAGFDTSCFGYGSNAADPFQSLRGPVADARRSVLNKYVLDANADCDMYGEELIRLTRNLELQKIAAAQLLQKKRLEFKMEEDKRVDDEFLAATRNFNECITELYDCYHTQETGHYPAWSATRIRTYCAQISNVPSCYQTMVCNPGTAQLRAVIDEEDKTSCDNRQDVEVNNCRNIVTLNELLNGVHGITNSLLNNFSPDHRTGINSGTLREYCIRNAIGSDGASIRQFGITWGPGTERSESTANRECSLSGALEAVQYWNSSIGTWGECVAIRCMAGYEKNGDTCMANSQNCANGYEWSPTQSMCRPIEYAIYYYLNHVTVNLQPAMYNADSSFPIMLPTAAQMIVLPQFPANADFSGWVDQITKTHKDRISAGTTGAQRFDASWTCKSGFKLNSTSTECIPE